MHQNFNRILSELENHTRMISFKILLGNHFGSTFHFDFNKNSGCPSDTHEGNSGCPNNKSQCPGQSGPSKREPCNASNLYIMINTGNARHRESLKINHLYTLQI